MLSDDDRLSPCFPACAECVVAGRGVRAGFQDRVRVVPGCRRESELRVCAARGGGARARAVFRRARAHAAPRKGTVRHARPPDHDAAARQGGWSLARSLRFRFVCQIVKYPTRDEVTSEQGIGPHVDANFLTFVNPPLLFSMPTFSSSPSALVLSSFPPFFREPIHTYRFVGPRDNQ